MNKAYGIFLAAVLLPLGCAQTPMTYKQPPPVTHRQAAIIDIAPAEEHKAAAIKVPEVNLKKRIVAAGFTDVGWDNLPRFSHDDEMLKESGGAERVNEILVNALHETGKFDVLERRRLDNVLDELNMKESGLLARDTAAQIGAMLGAQNVVLTAVGSNDDITTRMQAPIVAYLRLVDLTTGRITASARNADADLRSAISGAVSALARASDDIPWTGRIAQVDDDGGRLVINAGRDLGLKEGDVFAVYSIGDEVKDPVTGDFLGYGEKAIGLIRVTRVRDKMSIAQPIEITAEVKIGDLVRPGIE